MLRRMIALMLSLTLLCMPLLAGAELSTPTDIDPTTPPAPTEEPTTAPTEVPSEEPTETPTETPTQEPTQAPTEVPTEAPTEAPTAVPTEVPTPTQEPWDESVCDHANVHCAQAPACNVDGCAHIAQDVFGLDYPLCSLGQWLLDQQDRLLREGGATMYSMRRSTLTLDLDQADVTLWRSGTYTITGGEKRKDAAITLAKDRVVILSLRNVTADRLTLQSNVDVTLDLKALNALNTLEMRQSAKLTLTSGGALTIASVTRPTLTGTKEDTQILISGGNLDAKLEESKGRTLYRFDGQGASAVTVSGKAYNAVTPLADGSYCLWLKAPESGMSWVAAKEGDTLSVTQKAQGAANAGTIALGQTNTLTTPGTYVLSGKVPAGTKLVIDSDQVQVALQTATLPDDFVITGNHAYNLTLAGVSTAAGSMLQGSGTVTVSGDGALAFPSADAPLHLVSGALTLPQAPAGWTAYPVAGITAADHVTLDDAAMGLCWNGTDTLYLPTPAQGYAYALARESGTIRVHTCVDGRPLFLLAQSGQVDAGDVSAFDVQGTGSNVTGAITTSGKTAAAATFQNVQLTASQGAALSLSNGKALTVSLRGDNALSASGAPIALADGASLTLDCTSGRLLIKDQASLASITLKGNVKLVPEVPGNYTKLLLKDGNGNPVVNQQVTLRVGGKDYAYQTHYDGTLYLWGETLPAGTDVVARSDDEVYTAVLSSGETQVDLGVEITQVAATVQQDGSVKITFSVPEAGSAGVQYVTGASGQPLADCYVAEAARQDGKGEVILKGLTPGQVVSYRVYAARTAGMSLTADNDDGFQFSDVYTVKVLAAYTAPESADAVYTGKAYVCPFELPKGATVAYKGDALNRDGLPWQVGSYTMQVTIPEGDAAYIPGVYDIDFKITRIPLYIIPDPNQEKIEGEEDPEFTFTVKGLLKDDQVWGNLTREPGEDVGNYDFTLDMLYSEDYYSLRLVRGAYTFTILPGWDDPGVPPLITYEKLYPVRQEIVRKDGRQIAVVLNTQDTLTVTHSRIGGVVYNAADNTNRPVSPILRHNTVNDEVLLQLNCVPELNKDGGYVTDANGRAVYGGRYFRLSWLGLRGLHEQGIDSLSFSQGGVQVMVRLEDFLSDATQAVIKQLGGDLKQVRFKLMLLPADMLTQTEADAVSSARALTDAWQVSVSMLVGQESIPFEQYLPSLTVTVDAEPAAKLLTGLDLYQEETFADLCVLTQVTAEGQTSTPASVFVTPFQENELTLAGYPQVMFTHRYYAAPLTQQATVFLGRK